MRAARDERARADDQVFLVLDREVSVEAILSRGQVERQARVLRADRATARAPSTDRASRQHDRHRDDAPQAATTAQPRQKVRGLSTRGSVSGGERRGLGSDAGLASGFGIAHVICLACASFTTVRDHAYPGSGVGARAVGPDHSWTDCRRRESLRPPGRQ